MQIIELDQTPSIVNHFLMELRDKMVQQDKAKFRNNLEKIGQVMAFEISKRLVYETQPIQTPLGVKKIALIQEQPVILTILRAGLPFYQGFISFFNQADSGFIGAFRNEGTREEIGIDLSYMALGSIQDKLVIVLDPMLATGKSLIAAVKSLLKRGKPRHLHVACVVAAPEGIDYISKNLGVRATLWTISIDEKLNPTAYIVPGLGDAGDLSFGKRH